MVHPPVISSPYWRDELSQRGIANARTLLILFTESLNVRFAVGIEEVGGCDNVITRL
jgi:hypothetical protein